MLRALPRAVLDTIKALVNKPTGPYDTSGKSTAEIFEAVSHGKVAPEEAMVALQGLLMSATTNVAVSQVSKTMDTVKVLSLNPSPTQGVDGALLYIWAITHACVSTDRVGLRGSDEGSSSSTNHSFRLVRPRTV